MLRGTAADLTSGGSTTAVFSTMTPGIRADRRFAALVRSAAKPSWCRQRGSSAKGRPVSQVVGEPRKMAESDDVGLKVDRNAIDRVER